MMLDVRMRDLLSKAADALDDGQDPLGLYFLRENEVTADECFRLGSWFATCVRAYTRGSEVYQNVTFVIGATKELPVNFDVANNLDGFYLSLVSDKLIAKLGE